MNAELSETRRFSHRATTTWWRRMVGELGRATNLTGSGALLLVVAVGSWVLAYMVGGRPLYLLAYAALLVLVVSWVLGRRPLPLEGRRSDTRPRFGEGERIQMQVGLTARRRVSTFVLEDRVPPLLGESKPVAVASVEPGETVEQSYEVTAVRRGVYRLGPLVARWGDPFGLTQREVVLAEPCEVLVHPAVEAVEDRPLTRLFEDPPIRPPFSKPWPSGLEFYGMREYQPGDDIRMVVWRAFARTGQLLVREAEQGITDRVGIVLDTDGETHSPGEVSETFETAVRTVASVGVRHLKDGFAISMDTNGRRATDQLRGDRNRIRFLDELARVAREREHLSDCIGRLLANPRRDTHLVVVTPHLDSDAATQLRVLVERGVSVLLVMVVWDDTDPASMHRAGSLGTNIVEVSAGTPLEGVFRKVLTGRAHR